MYDGHRRAPVALSAVGTLMLGLAAGCAGAGGSGPVDEVSADTNDTTVTGSGPVGYVDDTFSSYAGPERVRGDAESSIVSVDFLADPGGISQAFVGVAADRPAFTVTTTEEPAAVVVTVEN
ncbi:MULTISPECIES: hypothetical protein [unclassified Rhodococcus (in: high G+C Gram-positive bacteria)]|uniref:hypothetical protein n=1 Tax=unclassified Rhodococcus (in: high G+C Gram-positive bacteria) TaxID=192944 RepID=UPI0011EDAC43|nr:MULTISPECIES: hypothetical protein [unclassified Rhodococcus (in: high G+C Gram-positive bacteria)]KAA0926667.1 hypothetical protein FQ188_07995 [Rhodococcus sp. ANT_H53B]MDI9924885.1 hypothetical protein [Rhodococcus sp. IEGM 1341]